MSLSRPVLQSIEIIALRTSMTMFKTWSLQTNRGPNFNTKTFEESTLQMVCVHLENNLLPHLAYVSRQDAIDYAKMMTSGACKELAPFL